MREIYGDMWSIECDAFCITTNGIVKRDGKAVMGAGVARQARDKFTGIDAVLGNLIRNHGNVCQVIVDVPSYPALVAFPTKNDYRNPSTFELIETSAHQLVRIATEKGWTKVILPRPGCNNGRLNWSDVRQSLEPILDDRFFIISR